MRFLLCVLAFFIQAHASAEQSVDAEDACQVLSTYPRGAKAFGFEDKGANFCEALWNRGDVYKTYKSFAEMQTRFRRDHSVCTPDDGTSAESASGDSESASRRPGDPTETQMVQFRGWLEDVRQSQANLCCGSDEICRRAMLKVGLEIQPRLRTTDASGIGFFESSPSQLGLALMLSGEPGGSLARVIDDPTIPHGSLRMSLFNPSPGVWRFSEKVARHELGHACSYIKSMRAAFSAGAAGADAREFLRRRNQSSTAISRDYARKFSALGLGTIFRSCLDRLAAANQKDFGDCRLNRRSRFEETYAITSAILGLNSQAPLEVHYRFMCNGYGGATHPLTRDVTECLMEAAPTLRGQMHDRLGCPKD